MTANQMILLLNIYRGTEDREADVGDYVSSLTYLEHSGYIQRSRDRNFVTPLAGVWIRDTVLKDPQ